MRPAYTIVLVQAWSEIVELTKVEGILNAVVATAIGRH